jgi:hypothetical protein
VADDVKLNAKVRKVIASCRLDLSLLRVRVTRGIVHLSGSVTRMGEDKGDPEANEASLERLDAQLRTLPGYRGINYTFENWRREPTGTWLYTGKRVKGSRK